MAGGRQPPQVQTVRFSGPDERAAPIIATPARFVVKLAKKRPR